MNIWSEHFIVNDHYYNLRITRAWAGMGWGAAQVRIWECLDYPATNVHTARIEDEEEIECIKADPETYIRVALL